MQWRKLTLSRVHNKPMALRTIIHIAFLHLSALSKSIRLRLALSLSLSLFRSLCIHFSFSLSVFPCVLGTTSDFKWKMHAIFHRQRQRYFSHLKYGISPANVSLFSMKHSLYMPHLCTHSNTTITRINIVPPLLYRDSICRNITMNFIEYIEI